MGRNNFSFECRAHRVYYPDVPRPPSLENSNHPLRLLRGLLSEQGSTAPMSQLRFSQLIDVPPTTVRAVENRQRSSSPSIRERIVLTTGARWNNQRKEWMYVYPETAVPFTFSHFLEFQQIVTKRPESDVRDFHREFARLMKLVKRCPDEYWHRLFFKFEKVVDDLEEEVVEWSKHRTAVVAEKKPGFHVSFHNPNIDQS